MFLLCKQTGQTEAAGFFFLLLRLLWVAIQAFFPATCICTRRFTVLLKTTWVRAALRTIRLKILTGAAVLLGQQVVGEWRGVGETLHRGVEEAGVPQVVETGSHPVHTLPLEGELAAREEHLLWCRDAVALAADRVL